MLDISFEKPNRRQKPTSAVWGRFFTLSHSQFIFKHDRIMPYLCTCSSESLRVTNSAQKYVISSIIRQRHKWKMASIGSRVHKQ